MNLAPLGAAARFINGAAFKPTDWGTEGLPIIRIQNLTGTGEAFNYTTRQVKQVLVVEPGDLLVSWSATLDVYRWGGPRGVLNQHIFKVLPSTNVDAEYLYYALKSVIGELERKTHGSTMKHVVRGDFESTRIPLPPLDEQRRIVDRLSRAEGIVRLRREAQAKAQAIIPALFLDMFGDPASNPKGSTVAMLGDLLAIPVRNGISPSRAGRHKGRVLTLSAITGGAFDDSAVKEAMFAAPLAESDQVSVRDFLVCRGNGNKSLVGVGCFPRSDMPGVAFPDTAIAVRAKPDLVSPRFLAVQWQSQWIRQQIGAIAKTTNGTYKINQTGLTSIKLVLPQLAAQCAFDERVRAIDSITRQQADAVQKAEAVFQSLLARTFTSALATESAPKKAAVA